MAIPAQYPFDGNGSLRIFPVASKIISHEYIKIFIDDVEFLDTTAFDIINNSVVFKVAPSVGVRIDIWVAESIEALANLGTITNVDLVGLNIADINLLGLNMADINYVAENIDAILAGSIGDMLKETYDTNGNGTVDNSEKVNGLTVETAVPPLAEFTDTTYPDATATTGGVITDLQAVKLEASITEVVPDDQYIEGTGVTGDPITFTPAMQTAMNFFVGTSQQDVQGNISSDGVTITAQVEALGGGDISYTIASGVQALDCTPTPATVVLTPGTDPVPVVNYIYIDGATNTLVANTTGFPTSAEYVPLAVTLLGSALFTQNFGTYKTHKWSDHLFKVGSNGHMSHLNTWIRNQPATWISGNAFSYAGSGTTNVTMAVSSGVIYQLHQHSTAQILTPAPAYIVNDEVTAYLSTTNLATILTDSLGTSLNNQYFSLVLWYAHSEIPNDAKLYINKPSGSYSSEADARSDSEKYNNYSIPKEFKGTAFLLHRLVCRLSGGALTIFDGAGDDLRGALPGTASGSSTSVASTFLDSTFRIENVADTTKQVAVDASAITTGTTRTITIPDQDVDLTGIVKTDVANTFTEAQRTQIDATQDNSIAFNGDNNFDLTATATAITVASQTVGQSGHIRIASAELITGWGTEFDWGNATEPTDLTGSETFSYFVWDASGVASISIGRV